MGMGKGVFVGGRGIGGGGAEMQPGRGARWSPSVLFMIFIFPGVFLFLFFRFRMQKDLKN